MGNACRGAKNSEQTNNDSSTNNANNLDKLESKIPEQVLENYTECPFDVMKITSKHSACYLEKIAELKVSQPNNIAVQAFCPQYFSTLDDEKKRRLMACVNSGVQNPDSGMGCYAMTPDDYDDLRPFFQKACEMYHKVDLNEVKHTNSWDLVGVEGLPESGVLDIAELGFPELSMRVRVGRNVSKYPLPGMMTQEDRCNFEKDMQCVFDDLIADSNYGGKYHSLTPGHKCFVNDAEYQDLIKKHFMFKSMSDDTYLAAAGIANNWPYGRGCYVSSDEGFIVWVGEEDHLRIMCMKKGTILNEVFDRLKSVVDMVEAKIVGGVKYSDFFGVVTSCPTNVGTGMRASLLIALPNLTKDGTDTKAKEIAKPLGLSVRGMGGEHTPIGADGTVDISPSKRFCISEAEIITALYKGIQLLKSQEDESG